VSGEHNRLGQRAGRSAGAAGKSARATRGFTLLEMLVASTIMGVAIVGLMAGLSGATRNASRLREYDRAVQLARLRMNDILADIRIHNTSTGGKFPPELVGGLEAGWLANVSKAEEGPAPFDGDYVLDRVQLEVWWLAGGQRRTFLLEGFRKRIVSGGDR
jgi:general secretion pathway protein I